MTGTRTHALYLVALLCVWAQDHREADSQDKAQEELRLDVSR